jgi:hypothetical protein
LISKKSGLARALEQYVPSHAAGSIVEVRDGPDALTRGIRSVLVDNATAFERARALRVAMVPHFNWKKSAEEFVEALSKAPRPGPLTPPSPGTPPKTSPTDALANAFAEASSHVTTWQQTLRSSGEWIERPELAQILHHARLGGDGPLVLLGAPGAGKSALLARAAQHLVDEGAIVLAIKADRLPRSVDSLDALARELGLPTDVESALIASSRLRNTVLVIDQMDALADLVDVETRRLDVLLALIERVSKHDSVRIVMSCRQFDYDHDVRLRRLNASELKLTPPDPMRIDTVLSKHGVDPKLLPPRMRDLLNTMQSLDVFLLIDPARRTQPGMDSYQKLLDALWTDRFAGRADRNTLESSAERLAGLMADREELWLSDALISTISDPPLRVPELQAIGILSRDGDRIAFSHQTLFEFARARHFLSQHTQLPAYVRARHTGLFVRPTLWTTLAYLRSADMQPYLEQLEELWLDKDLRSHIHRLLIDFLGQVENPDPREAVLLASGLHDDRWRGVTIEAITARPAWFELVRRVDLPALMTGPNANMVTILLSQAIAFAPDSVAELIEDIWLPQSTSHLTVATVLFYAPAWPSRFQALATAIVETGALEFSVISRLIHTAISTSPPTASRIITIEIEARRAAAGKRAAGQDAEGRRAVYREHLEEVSGIDSLVDVAGTDPEGFVSNIWPWFVSVVDEIAHPSRDLQYREDYSLATSLESGFRELPQALQESLTFCAKRPGFTRDFVARWSVETTVAIHRVLIATIEATLPEAVSLAVDYLVADPRRLNVGDLSFRDGWSVRLVRAVAPLAALQARERLEAAILTSESTSPSLYEIESRRYAYDANRRHRLRLMRALGEHASASINKLREEEERRFPGDEEGFDPNMRLIASPVSTEQMLRARDEDILHLFDELPDSTAHHHPERWMEGGSSQASQAFGEAAKKDPERFLRMLTRFDPGVSEQPVVRALWSLAEITPLARIEKAVLELVSRGFFSNAEERSDVAWAIERATRGHGKAGRQQQISESICGLLESWLDAGPRVAPQHNEESAEVEKTDELVGSAGGGSLPSGNYPILDALTTAYLDRSEPDIDRWMRLLEEHVKRDDNPEVWRALSMQLHNVLFAEPMRAERFLDSLFARFPTVRDSRRGITIIARAMSRLPPATVLRWIADVEAGKWHRKEQAAGELLGWFATRSDAPSSVRERLAHESAHGSESVRRGIAYSAAHMWHYMERRKSATSILVQLIPSAVDSVAEALMSTFRREAPVLDDSTREVIVALGEHPNVIVTGKGFGFMEVLRDLLPSAADIVASTALSVVKFTATQQDRTYTLSQSSELIDIAMTLQRLGPRYRERGLDLFEFLLAQNAYGARDVLDELDPTSRRSVHGPRSVPRRPRWRHRGLA